MGFRTYPCGALKDYRTSCSRGLTREAHVLDNGQHKLVPVNDIQLDYTNPRIARFLEMYPREEITPDRIFLALGASSGDEEEGGPTFTKLKQSILTSRTIIQPIILNRQEDGTLVCVDGNTRVALYRDFLTRNVPGQWKQIPSIIYTALTETDIDAIRLQAHLVGPRPWDPYSKAKYLNYLREREHIPYSELVDFCGGSQKMVRELIEAYNDMERFYRPLLPDDSAFDVRRFSGFVELQKPGIKESILAAGHTLSDFAQWIMTKKINALREVRLLPKIMRHQKAHEVFLRRGADEAVKTLETPELSKALQEATLVNLCRALVVAYDRITLREVQDMKADPGSTAALSIAEASEALDGLVKELGLNEQE